MTLASQASRLSDRAHQDREIVYFPNDPSTHSFNLYHDYTESRPGVAHYFNVVRAGSSVSNPSAVLLDTGEALKVETISGAELKKRGLDAGEPVTDTTQIVVISFPAVKPGQSVRLRITETYTDANRYTLDGDELVWDRAFGRPRNSVVLPAGWTVVASSTPAVDHAGCRRPPAFVFREQPERRDPGIDSRARGRAVMTKIRSRSSDRRRHADRRRGAVARSDHRRRHLEGARPRTVLDLSEDGRLVAIGARRLYDNAETNHRRYGDPTYFAPTMVEVQVINTRTGAADKVGKGLMNVRQAAFTRDGARLAMLTAAETPAGLPITSLWVYDVAKKTLVEVPRSRGAEVAANSELSWTADGSRLLVALRAPEDDVAAQAAFKTLVSGPVVVQSSKPFLDWDAMSRANRRRELARDRSGHRRQGVRGGACRHHQLSVLA